MNIGYYIHSCQKMRYKANYRPQYILGKQMMSSLCLTRISMSNYLTLLSNQDPESNTWDPLDGELAQKLDTRPYVSLSRDQSSTAATESSTNPPFEPDVNEEELSLFDIHMPGVLTLDEVKALDLDHWHLLFHGTFVEMMVRNSHLSPIEYMLHSFEKGLWC